MRLEFSHRECFIASLKSRCVGAGLLGVLMLVSLPLSQVQANPQLPKPVAPLRAQAPPNAPGQGMPGQPPAMNNDPNDQPGPRIPNSLVLRKFDDALFLAAQSAGRSILVVFSKSDCPGCTLQVPSLQRVLKEDEFKAVEVFQVDFINQPQLAQRFNVRGWTAILGFKGSENRMRIQGLNRPSLLRQEIRKVL